MHSQEDSHNISIVNISLSIEFLSTIRPLYAVSRGNMSSCNSDPTYLGRENLTNVTAINNYKVSHVTVSNSDDEQ